MKIPRVRPRVNNLRAARNAFLRRTLRCSHIAYFGAVAVEGHGFYQLLGGAMFVLVSAEALLHFEKED